MGIGRTGSNTPHLFSGCRTKRRTTGALTKTLPHRIRDIWTRPPYDSGDTTRSLSRRPKTMGHLFLHRSFSSHYPSKMHAVHMLVKNRSNPAPMIASWPRIRFICNGRLMVHPRAYLGTPKFAQYINKYIPADARFSIATAFTTVPAPVTMPPAANKSSLLVAPFSSVWIMSKREWP